MLPAPCQCVTNINMCVPIFNDYALNFILKFIDYNTNQSIIWTSPKVYRKLYIQGCAVMSNLFPIPKFFKSLKYERFINFWSSIVCVYVIPRPGSIIGYWLKPDRLPLREHRTNLLLRMLWSPGRDKRNLNKLYIFYL